MATNTRIPLQGRRERDYYAEITNPPEVYSIASITLMDGTTKEFMVKASPSVVPHLTKEMSNTGFLTLWNDSDTLCIRADQVKHFEMRQVTTNEGTNK